MADYLFLYRSHEALRPFLEFPLLPKTEPATEADYPRMLDLLRHYEGEESARLLEHWLWHQPEGAWVIRGEGGELSAFMQIVRLDRSIEEQVLVDPVTRLVWEYLQEENLLGPADVATVTRFVVDAETYQQITPNMASMAVSLLRHCLTVPNLKFTFNIMADPERWEPFALASGFFKRARDLVVNSGRRPKGVFVQDWRHESPAAWIARVAPEQHWREGRGEEGTAHAGLAPDRDEQELLAGRDTFAKAVRDALKHFHVPDRLAKNPLLNSALVARRAGDRADSDSKARALQAVITEVVEFLGTVPKRAHLYQALRYTYLEPQGSQEWVAEWLDLPFSTYRGHLRAGIDVLTDILWRKDVEARR